MTSEPPAASEPTAPSQPGVAPDAAAASGPGAGDGGALGRSPFAEDRVEEDAARVTEVLGQFRAGPRLQWPSVAVLAGLVTSLFIVAGDHFRRGSVLFALFVGLAFVLRLMLPEQRAGWLAVRSRRVDLLVLGSLAGALMVFSLIVPPPS